MKKKAFKSLTIFLICIINLAIASIVKGSEYNPLFVTEEAGVTIKYLSVLDNIRQREIPIKAYIPPKKDHCSVVLFSHGLGGSRDTCSYLGKHWAARGYLCIFMQHPGSDEAVWKSASGVSRISNLKQAANLKNALMRYKDIPAVIDQLQRWNKEPKHVLFKRMDLTKIGMSGHSFGAVTTQAVSGQSFGFAGTRFTDSRIKAAIALSPSSPRRCSPEKAFARVKIPWLLMTGTNDIGRIGGANLESRLAVFPALPSGDKYELVLNNAEHSAFTDRILKNTFNNKSRNPNHHRTILAISTAFWDTYLNKNEAAKKWLEGPGPSSVLEAKDRWQKK